MKQLFTTILLSFLLFPFVGMAQDILNTSFEDYTNGNLNSQNKWSVSKGSATVVEDEDYAAAGTKGVKFSATSGLTVSHEAFSKTTEGLVGDVYIDFRLKINSIATSALTITSYDLTSNSRGFMLEFPADGKNTIKVYNGSGGSSTTKPTYTSGEWTRISIKIDNTGTKWQLAINGSVYEELLNFREIKSGATTLDYHSITFAQSSGTSDMGLDDIHIGSTPIDGIDFAGSSGERNRYTITVTQPENATIALSPLPDSEGKYYEGSKVTASITIHDLCNYRFANWTGDATGDKIPLILTVNSDMALSAKIEQNTGTGTTYNVKNYNELKDALNNMNPGDIVLLEDGDYSGNGLSITRSGCDLHPIMIKAKNQGKANILGKLYFTFKGVEYITIEGLNFNTDHVSSIIKLEGSNNIRITKNEFRMQNLVDGQTSKWILISDVWDNKFTTSHHNRIDHNLFDTKLDGGSLIVIDGAHGTSPGDISKYDRIDHNHFKNVGPRAANEKETIRIGVSDLTPCKAYCTVEYNLFEDCDGDPEVVSVKSWDNVIRYNTFRRCLGTVCLRQGGNNLVDGNYFFGEGKTDEAGNGCGGVRVYGEKHRIINNYFEGLTGEKWDAACTITNGDAAVTSTSWSAHFIPKDVVFAFNTYVNNKSNIEIGFTNNDKYGKAPEECIIANNVYIEDGAPIVKAFSTKSLAGVTFSNNIMHPTGTSSVGISATEAAIKVIDPLLIKTDCPYGDSNCNETLPYAIYKLKAGSPAIDAANGAYDYVSADSEGQTRGAVKDIGADEYSTNPVSIGVIGPQHVGPNAIPFELNNTTGIGDNNSDNSSLKIYQNESGEIQIEFPTQSNSSAIVNIYNLTGARIHSISANNGNINISDLPQGIYIVEVIADRVKDSRKIIVSK